MLNEQIIIIQQYEIGNYRALAEPCIYLYYATLMTTRKLGPLLMFIVL